MNRDFDAGRRYPTSYEGITLGNDVGFVRIAGLGRRGGGPAEGRPVGLLERRADQGLARVHGHAEGAQAGRCRHDRLPPRRSGARNQGEAARPVDERTLMRL